MSKILCDSLYDKIKSEHQQFITELKTKPANDIILSAYEIVTKNEIMLYCENEDPDLTDEQFRFLLSRLALLDELYEYWCSNGELTSYDDIGIALKEIAKTSCWY